MNRPPANEPIRRVFAQIFGLARGYADGAFAQVFACVIVAILLTGTVVSSRRITRSIESGDQLTSPLKAWCPP